VPVEGWSIGLGAFGGADNNLGSPISLGGTLGIGVLGTKTLAFAPSLKVWISMCPETVEDTTVVATGASSGV
jgi:hypothetical protein